MKVSYNKDQFFKQLMPLFSNFRSFGLITLCLVTPLVGQENGPDEDRPIELKDFVVRDNTVLEPVEMLGTPIGLLSGEDLKREVSASLGETLNWEPGVSSSFYGPVASRPVIRGQSGYRAGVYIRGTQTGDLSSASPDHAVAQEPLFIDEIEIIKGPATLLYGSGAIGGAVNLSTNTIPKAQPTRAVEAEAEVRYGSVSEEQTAGIATTARAGEFAFQFNALTRETEDYEIPGFARTPDYDFNNRSRLPPGVPQPLPNSEGIVRNTHSSLETGSFGGTRFFENGRLGAAVVVYNTDYGVPTDGHAHGNPAGLVFGPGPNDVVVVEMEHTKGEAVADFRPETDWLETLSLAAQYSDIKQDESEGAFLGNQFDGQTFDLRLLANTATFGSWKYSGGASISGFDLSNRNISYVAGRADEDTLATRSRSGAIFGFAQYRADQWDAQVGARAEFQEAKRKDLANLSRNDEAFSFSFGGSHQLGETYRVGVAASYLERVPTADEFYVEAPHGAVGVFQIPTPSLENEESIGIDLSFSKESGPWTFTLTGFFREFDNFIFLENQGFEVDGLPAYNYVQRQAEFYGGEIESEWKLINEEDTTLTLTAIWDLVYGEDTTEEDHLPRMPPTRLGARLDYVRGNLGLGLGVRHAFQQDRVPQAVFGTLEYQSPTDSYTFVDANAYYTIIQGDWETRLFVNGTNLSDEEGRNSTSFLKDVAPLPGRNFTIGFELTY